MSDSPTTQRSLLMRLQSGADKQSWALFVELYAPLVHTFLRRRGLQEADAADLTQDVLMAVARRIDSFQYDPARCTFRHWLLTIVENRLRNFWRQRDAGWRGSGGTEAYELLASHEQSSNGHATQWDREYERHLFQVAAEQVRGDFKDSTWSAFSQTALEKRPGKEVAADLGTSVAAVYMSKRRVITRIREQIKFLQGDSE